jgi:hypothetical protein
LSGQKLSGVASISDVFDHFVATPAGVTVVMCARGVGLGWFEHVRAAVAVVDGAIDLELDEFCCRPNKGELFRTVIVGHLSTAWGPLWAGGCRINHLEVPVLLAHVSLT